MTWGSVSFVKIAGWPLFVQAHIVRHQWKYQLSLLARSSELCSCRERERDRRELFHNKSTAPFLLLCLGVFSNIESVCDASHKLSRFISFFIFICASCTRVPSWCRFFSSLSLSLHTAHATNFYSSPVYLFQFRNSSLQTVGCIYIYSPMGEN